MLEKFKAENILPCWAKNNVTPVSIVLIFAGYFFLCCAQARKKEGIGLETMVRPYTLPLIFFFFNNNQVISYTANFAFLKPSRREKTSERELLFKVCISAL